MLLLLLLLLLKHSQHTREGRSVPFSTPRGMLHCNSSANQTPTWREIKKDQKSPFPNQDSS